MPSPSSMGQQAWSLRLRESLAFYLREGEPGVAKRIDEMCAATGLDRSRVYAWRSGRSLPNAYAIALMAEWFGSQYPDFTADRLLGLMPTGSRKREER